MKILVMKYVYAPGSRHLPMFTNYKFQMPLNQPLAVAGKARQYGLEDVSALPLHFCSVHALCVCGVAECLEKVRE